MTKTSADAVYWEDAPLDEQLYGARGMIRSSLDHEFDVSLSGRVQPSVEVALTEARERCAARLRAGRDGDNDD